MLNYPTHRAATLADGAFLPPGYTAEVIARWPLPAAFQEFVGIARGEVTFRDADGQPHVIPASQLAAFRPVAVKEP